MTVNIEVPVTPAKSRKKIVLIALPVLVLLLAYGAGIFVLPVQILTRFQERNCDSVLSLHRTYTVLYPSFIEDTSLFAQAEECEAYTLAVTGDEHEQWQDAYAAYQAYAKKYPNGMYARDAYERSAAALVNIVRGQTEQQQYADALKNLDLIISGFSDTKASADAWTLTPEVFTAWGSSLRDAGNFEEAESVFTDFKSWSEQYQRTETVSDANRELTNTYILWGQALLSEQQFESAIAKFELAVAIDLEPDSNSRPAERKAYAEWGNYLLEQKDFAGAIEKFELALSRAGGSNEDSVKDALSNGYVQWATDLRTSEDYLGALEKLEKAKEAAFADEMKEAVETAFGETYLAFSTSSGTQAQRAMEEASKTICEQNEKPELPIFGLNKDSVRAAVYGVQVMLTESVAAKTPSEMHYVACITEKTQIVQRKHHLGFVTNPAGGYDVVQQMGNKYFVVIFEDRLQFVWDVHLRSLSSAVEVDATTLTGNQPGPFTGRDLTVPGKYVIYGKPPQIDLLLKWLQETLARVD